MAFVDNDGECGVWEADCAGCEIFARVDDVGLCEECAAMLDRDLVRERQWDYSAMAFAMPPERREEMRDAVIKEFGKGLELIMPLSGEPAKRKRRKRATRRGNRRHSSPIKELEFRS